MESAIADVLKTFFAAPRSEARRVFHGRGRLHPTLEHLTVDWYPPLLLVVLHDAWDGVADLVSALPAQDRHAQVRSVVVQHRYRPGTPAETVWGQPLPVCLVREGDLCFEVQAGKQQNAGLFLDMRPLRAWLRHHSEGRSVLNLFAYTCTLSVAALAGGARQVVNVDMSRTALAWGERNHRHNGQDLDKVRFIPHNLFTSWGRIQQFGRYDLIIIDPPTRQRGSFDAARDYAAVLRKVPKLAAPGADLILALNSPFQGPDFLHGLMTKYLPEGRFVEPLPVAPEFVDREPDRGLKLLRFTL